MSLISRVFPLLSAALALGLAAVSPASSAPPKAADSPASSPAADSTDTAFFAGGSFWCLEAAFEGLPGVDSATAGYTGGQGPNPNFESVTSGNSSYVEAVRVLFRPKRIGYAKLLDAYWRNVDPTRADGQFSDAGVQFRPIVFYRNAPQQAAAEVSRAKLAKSGRFPKPILAEIAPATVFYPAEPEHQDYHKRKAPHYRAYVKFSGREAFLKKVWGAKGMGPKAAAPATAGTSRQPLQSGKSAK
jgi:methionine-S-sulfoxide reductase